MSEKKLLTKFDEILSILDEIEKSNRLIHAEALDIEDLDESKKLMDDSFEKIRKVKQWKKEISTLVDDIDNFFNLNVNSLQEVNINKLAEPSQISLSIEDSENEVTTFIEKNMKVREEEDPNIIESKTLDEYSNIAVLTKVEAREDNYLSENSSKLNGFSLLDVEYSVLNWKDLIVRVCESLIIRKPYLLSKIHSIEDFQNLFSEISSNENSQTKMLSNGLYVNLDKDDDELEEIVFKLLDYCGINHEKFKIKV